MRERDVAMRYIRTVAAVASDEMVFEVAACSNLVGRAWNRIDAADDVSSGKPPSAVIAAQAVMK